VNAVNEQKRNASANNEELVKQVGREVAAASHYSEPRGLPGVDRQLKAVEDSLWLNK
jgi:hypothetical protein